MELVPDSRSPSYAAFLRRQDSSNRSAFKATRATELFPTSTVPSFPDPSRDPELTLGSIGMNIRHQVFIHDSGKLRRALAQVEMQLIVGGTSICITHMGRDFVLIESAVNNPPCAASILLGVDGSESRWNVRLPHGISARSNRVALAPAA